MADIVSIDFTDMSEGFFFANFIMPFMCEKNQPSPVGDTSSGKSFER